MPTSTSRRPVHAGPRRRRARTWTTAAVTALVCAVALSGGTGAASASPRALPGTDPLPGVGTSLPPDDGQVRPLATIEDEEAWCSYLSSYYLAFPSPWSARVYNCQHRSMFVAPVFSNGTVGMCVLVPARHSRHLGGNVSKWVTDIRIC